MNKQDPSSLQCNFIKSLLNSFLLWTAILVFAFLYFFNSIFESHWDEIGVNNISCKALEIPNCTEESGTVIIRDVYTKNDPFDNRVQLTIHSKGKKFIMFVRNDAITYRVHFIKKTEN